MALINGKCEQCINEGKTSTVYKPWFGSTTLMSTSPGYYDHNGQYRPPYNPNRTTYEWSCSNGHTWTEVK